MSQSGLPTLPLQMEPSRGPGMQDFPITANFVHKTQTINRKTIFVIALSAAVLLIVCCAAICVIIKYKKLCNSSSALHPQITRDVVSFNLGMAFHSI